MHNLPGGAFNLMSAAQAAGMTLYTINEPAFFTGMTRSDTEDYFESVRREML